MAKKRRKRRVAKMVPAVQPWLESEEAKRIAEARYGSIDVPPETRDP